MAAASKMANRIIDKDKKGIIDDITRADECNYWTTIFPLAQFESEFSNLANNISFYKFIYGDNMHEDDAVLQAVSKAEKHLDKYAMHLNLNKDIYKAFLKYREVSGKTGEWNRLDDEERLYVDKIISDMERFKVNNSKIAHETKWIA